MRAVLKSKPWHSLGRGEVLNMLETSGTAGLTEREVKFRLQKFGKNIFYQSDNSWFFKSLYSQIKSPLVFILIMAGLVTFAVGEFTDSVVIFIAVAINIIIGLFEEGKASKAFSKLRDSQAKTATVIREGKKMVIDATELVLGDVIKIQAGEQIPADARLLEQKGLEVNEAVLTGEWIPVYKDTKKCPEETIVNERKSMIWMGTLVTEGWGMAVIVATGLNTEVGKIAGLLEGEESPLTPFQKSVKKLARTLGFVIMGILVGLFMLGIYRDHNPFEMFRVAVAVAVAAIPEGLPAAVSFALAMGMDRILSKGGLVKNIGAVETLGSITAILTDKTGTITQSLMRVSGVVTYSRLFEDKNKISKKDARIFDPKDDRLTPLKFAVLATDAFIENPDDGFSDWVVRGSPLEKSLVMACAEAGIYQHKLSKLMPRLDYMPFDSERRFGASLNDIEGGRKTLFVIGSPDYILENSQSVLKSGKISAFSAPDKKIMENEIEKYAIQGSRVVGVAFKETDWDMIPRETDHRFGELVFSGFISFHDPLRPDIDKAVEAARQAGILTVMITGDHEKTAEKTAEEAGIAGAGAKVLSGKSIDEADDEKMKELARGTKIFARILPHQKLKIVKAFQANGETVAMVGDGINDAPAVKRAEVGVSVGSGTEVTKEAADIVLLNDSFSILISAVEEGRRALVNLRKIVLYLLSTGFSEIILLCSALAAGLPLPVLPAQILWANIVEEGFMNFAFAFEPSDKSNMKRKPSFFAGGGIFEKETGRLLFLVSFTTSMFLVALFVLLNNVFGYEIEKTRSIIFAAISVDSVFFAFSIKNLSKSIFSINIFSNIYLVVSVLISLVFLCGALFFRPLMDLLSVVSLNFYELLLVALIGVLNVAVIEFGKYYFIRRPAKIAG